MIQPILLTGCARSGTSMTAGIISFCGAFGGKMSGPNDNNKKGMFENAEIRNNFVKPYLASIGADPMGQNPLPEAGRLRPYPYLREDVEKTLGHQGYKSGPWFYKGAKMCLMWSVWHAAFPKAKWIIVRRKDEDIIASCLKTGFMRAFNDEMGWQWWVDQHKKRFEEMKAAGLDVQEIWPTKFVHGDLSEIRTFVDMYGGLKWNEKAVADFITPAWWSTGRQNNGS